MQQYLTRIENNLYIPPDIGAPLNHGYSGWLNTAAPSTNVSFSKLRHCYMLKAHLLSARHRP